MTFFETIPPLASRVMDQNGTATLKAVRDLSEKGFPANIIAISRKAKLTQSETWRAVNGLDNARLIETNDTVRQVFTLTDTGWDAAGGKPVWMGVD